MRVISGVARGTLLFSPQGMKTRPTSDFVKENLFNLIRGDVYDVNFLDMFAGTGAIGIEALSRGAASATFVDISPKCVTIIRRNLEKTRMSSKAVVIKSDAMAAIKKLSVQKFNLIFLDPPYLNDFTEKILQAVVEHKILADDGYIVAEMSKSDEIPTTDGLEIFKIKEYSGTRLVFYKARRDV